MRHSPWLDFYVSVLRRVGDVREEFTASRFVVVMVFNDRLHYCIDVVYIKEMICDWICTVVVLL